jgi:hypothetical protein
MQLSNQPQWTAGRRGFYEVWYFKLNLPKAGPALWLRLTTLCGRDGKKQVAELWGIFFEPSDQGTATRHVAVKETLPVTEFAATDGEIRIRDAFWGDGRTAGAIRSGGSEISWDLGFEPNTRGFDHVPPLFKALKLNKTTVVTPNPDLRFNGTFRINGREYTVSAAPGMQGHIWGVKNAIGWAWGHANCADDGTPFVFEGLTARIKLGGLLTSPPVSAFYFEYEGKPYSFASLSQALRAESRYTLEDWDFSVSQGDLTFRGKINTPASAFSGVQYEDTDGSHLYCHNSKISDLRLEVLRGGRLEREIRATRTCAYELVARERDSRVELLI